jgi:ATP-dependent RNA helicase DDX18/HAS1
LLASLQDQKSARTIVFCNKIETCRKVENFLNRSIIGNDVEVLPYHAAIAGEKRDANLSKFLSTPRQTGSEEQKRLILVCTDRASRGVDSSFVDHVILFDFPREPSEYVRRVGRTARGAGGQGVVTVLVLGRQVKLAQHVSGRNQKGLPVHSIPAVIPANIDM